MLRSVGIMLLFVLNLVNLIDSNVQLIPYAATCNYCAFPFVPENRHYLGLPQLVAAPNCSVNYSLLSLILVSVLCRQ